MKNFEDVLKAQLEIQENTDKNDRANLFVKIWRDQDFVHKAHLDVVETVDILA